MRIAQTLFAATSMVALGTASMADTPSDDMMPAPVVMVEDMPPATSSVDLSDIIMAFLAALVIAAAVTQNDAS